MTTPALDISNNLGKVDYLQTEAVDLTGKSNVGGGTDCVSFGLGPDVTPLFIAVHGASNVDCAIDWFAAMNMNRTTSPCFAATLLGVKDVCVTRICVFG